MKNNRFHFFLFALTVGLLLFVLVQSITHWIPARPLEGYTDEESEDDTIQEKTLFDGSLQDYLANYAKQNTGFREFFIRSHNQLSFSLFNESSNENIVKGLHNQLYLKMYVDDITGLKIEQEYENVENAKEKAQANVKQTLALIETLRQHGTKFLFVFCPSKAIVYPEFLPKKYRKQVKDFQLMDYYIQLFEENHIPYIDFYHYFKDIKDEYPYPLYAKTGSHWAESTIPMVSDSILRKMEELMDIQLPKVKVVDLNITKEYSIYEDELEAVLNLLFPMRKPAIPQPITVLDDTTGKARPNLLVIGDSYFNQIRLSSFVHAFNHWDFWVYNKNVYSSRPFYNKKQLNMVFDANEVLEDADIVLAMITSPHLPRYLFGFTDNALKLLQQGITFNEVIEQIIQNIKDKPDWYASVAKQAEERGISVEDNLKSHAEYIYYSYLGEKQKLKSQTQP